jgi:hypothetical protein
MLPWALAAGGVIWLGVLLLFMAGLQRAGSTRGLAPPAHAPALVRTLNQPQAESESRWWSWRVTHATSAMRAMIVEVEAQQVADAKSIAAQIVEPVRTHGYDEILIYVRRPGADSSRAERRVQWTPRGGYVELVME